MLKNRKMLFIPLTIFILSLCIGCQTTQKIAPSPSPSQSYNIQPQKLVENVEKNVPMPKQLTVIGSNSEGIILDVARNDWSKVNDRLSVIKTKYNELVPLMQMTSNSKKIANEIGTCITNLQKQVAAKKGYETMFDANKITKYLADASDIFKPSVPTDLARLSYLGREIDLNATANKWTDARTNLDSAEKIWSGLKNNLTSTYSIDVSGFNTVLTDLSKSIADKNLGTVKSNVKRMTDGLSVLELDFYKQNNSK